MRIGARLVKAFCRLDFSTKSTLGFQKQVLSVRTTPRGLCGQRFFLRLEFSSRIDAWASKAGFVSQNAY